LGARQRSQHAREYDFGQNYISNALHEDAPFLSVLPPSNQKAE
jgi:hypothetical protein